mmetsp:Transcript_35803/g.57583  ORF Transcript_35803/g.57583 Transcript_35803/m.57583 type:complete len:265 (-) Transcript_35803:275-1069(-)
MSTRFASSTATCFSAILCATSARATLICATTRSARAARSVPPCSAYSAVTRSRPAVTASGSCTLPVAATATAVTTVAATTIVAAEALSVVPVASSAAASPHRPGGDTPAISRATARVTTRRWRLRSVLSRCSGALRPLPWAEDAALSNFSSGVRPTSTPSSPSSSSASSCSLCSCISSSAAAAFTAAVVAVVADGAVSPAAKKLLGLYLPFRRMCRGLRTTTSAETLATCGDSSSSAAAGGGRASSIESSSICFSSTSSSSSSC